MQDLLSLFHDLSNKVLLLTSTLEGQKRGLSVPDEKLNAIVNKVIDLSESIRSSLSKNMQLTYNVSSPEKIHEDVKSFLPQLESLYSPMRIVLDPQVDETAQRMEILWEKNLLFQMIENAVENSFKARSRSFMIVLSEESGNLRIIMIDDGEGIPGASQYEFYPLGGFGSRIIHNNAIRMNGEATYSRVPQGGTCVTVRLPHVKKAQ
jgi:signal transduction histidine kinase